MPQTTLIPLPAALPSSLSRHASIRMQQRCIPPEQVDAAIAYGRRIRSKGVTYCVVGHKEVTRYASQGVDLGDAEGVQVLIAPNGAVVTVYRSNDLHQIKVTSRNNKYQRGH